MIASTSSCLNSQHLHDLSSHSNQNINFHNPVPCKANPNILKLIQPTGTKVVNYRNIHPGDDAYNDIINLISNEEVIIENLVQIDNPFLTSAYNLKKHQKISQYGKERVREELMFHDTEKDNVDNICTYNFDWRLYGQNNDHKFGKGVHFSPSAMYISNNCADAESYHKVMIVAKVLIANTCQDCEDMVVPSEGCDTSIKHEGLVVVKYEDHEFLPMFKICYHLEKSEELDEEFSTEEEDGEGDFSAEEEEDYWEMENLWDDEGFSSDEEEDYFEIAARRKG